MERKERMVDEIGDGLERLIEEEMEILVERVEDRKFEGELDKMKKGKMEGNWKKEVGGGIDEGLRKKIGRILNMKRGWEKSIGKGRGENSGGVGEDIVVLEGGKRGRWGCIKIIDERRRSCGF